MSRISELFLISILISFSFIALAPMHGIASETVKLYVDPFQILNESLVPGTFFNVSLKVDDIPASPGLAGVEFKVNYDPTLLSVVVLEEVMFHNVTPLSDWDNIWRVGFKINNTEGFVSCAYTWQDIVRALDGGYAPISGNHTIATIGFEVKGTGSCTLTFSQPSPCRVKLGDMHANAIPCEVFDGFFSNSASARASLRVHITPPQLNETQVSGSIFNFSVGLDDNATSSGIMSVAFMLTWDPTILEAVNMTEIVFHEVTPQNEWNNIRAIREEINNTDGYLVYAYEFANADRAVSFGYAPITGNHTLAIIAFRVKDTGKSALHFADTEVRGTTYSILACSTVDGVFMNLLRGDLNADNAVDIYDALAASQSFGSFPGSIKWNWAADIDKNGVVDIYDIIMLAANFGRHA